MNQDVLWAIIRYGLIAGGSVLVTRGYLTDADVITIIGAVGSLVTVAWGIYVKSNTHAVPSSTAARDDVPTVNAATGAVEPATRKRSRR